MSTKMKTISFIIFLTFFIASSCNKESKKEYRFKFHFITENFEPFNYTEGDKLTGLTPDILKEICESLNIPFDINVMQWDEAYQTAQTTQNAVLFATSLNTERKDLFKWAGPIATMDWYFYALAQNHFDLNSLEEAKTVNSIGVLRDYTIEQFLVQQGFTNLVYCNDHQDAITKLISGEIDLYPSDKITAEAVLNTMQLSIYTLKEVLPIKTEMIYFAFNKLIPDDVVADFQVEIDRLKNNGFLKQLYQKYFNSSDFPGTLQIYTESYPPITFMSNFGEITGYGSEIAKEIMKRNRLFIDIKLSTWSNGYELALINPNFCLFTMDRTPVRENLFHWVGPIGTNSTYFYTRAGSDIVINSIEDAMNLASVGTVSSWFSDQHLRNLGFTNLISDSSPAVMTVKLLTGEIDAFVCSEVTFPDILRSQDYQYNQVNPAFPLMSSDYYITFSKTTSNEIVNQWQTTFSAIQQDGTLDAIRRRWFPD
ncbi:MAG: transporter substrate-binding domain-containing protein [Bacteroidales bacterium]|nr:transporter substrate-binding domain-containing protein [Bacteroidales bacterium]